MKFRIFLISSDRFWGQEYWTEDFDTYEEAKRRIEDVNSKNISWDAPDFYIQAETRVEAVD